VGDQVVVRHVTVGDQVLCIAESGVGGRPLLALHGWTGVKEDFDDWYAAFAEAGWHFVAVDHRGHGDSSKPDDEAAYTCATLAADALALADELGWSQFALLGHSMGGMVAQHVALADPDRLTHLVLLDTHHGAVDVPPALVAAGVDAARTFGTALIADMTALQTEPGPLDSDAHARVCAERPGYADRGPASTRASCAAAFAGLLVELAERPSRLAELGTLQIPTLVMVGEQDAPFLEASVAMAETIPGAQLVVLVGAGHSPQFEAPEQWWSELTGFLDQVPARRER